MSAQPKDPLAFDFGFNFESAASRVTGEAEERAKLVARELKYHVGFLDDCARGILPTDLVLLGAETGAGKTQLATNIAMMNVHAGKTVHYIALEAEHREIERRIKFALLAECVRRHGDDITGLNYPDWYRGQCEHIVGRHNAAAEEKFQKRYSRLHTYYRGSKFGHDDIRRLLLAIQSETDLVILDHLHYVDIDDENENRGFKQTLKMIRDVTLGMERPMILIAHIRKRDARSRAIVPDLEMFHGSSDIIKIITHAVMLAPARSIPSKQPSIAHTFMHVPKDRRGGATGHVALCRFERSMGSYDKQYTLGHATGLGDVFEPIDLAAKPRWATRHVPQSVLTGGIP